MDSACPRHDVLVQQSYPCASCPNTCSRHHKGRAEVLRLHTERLRERQPCDSGSVFRIFFSALFNIFGVFLARILAVGINKIVFILVLSFFFIRAIGRNVINLSKGKCVGFEGYHATM